MDELIVTAAAFQALKAQHQEEHALKRALYTQGFSLHHINKVTQLASKQEVHSLLDYFEKHSLQGFSFSEMHDCLLERGIDPEHLAVATGLYKQQSFY